MADKATPPQIYDEEGTCKSAAIFFLDRSLNAGLVDMVVGLPVGGGHGVNDSNREGGRQAVADEATPLKDYDEQGTCRSASIFFLAGSIKKNDLHCCHSPTSFYEERAVEDDGLPRANKGLPKDLATIDINGLLRANNSLSKDSNSLPKDSATIDNNGLPYANNVLTKDSAAFEDGGLPHDDGNGLPKDLAAIDPTPAVKLGFKGTRAKKIFGHHGRGEETKKSAVSRVMFSPSITWNHMSFDHVI